jgi:hypothetical protein
MRRLPRRLAIWGGAAAVAGAGFALMASNTFTAHPGAGTGTVSVSGYVISSPVLTGCNTTTSANPENICWAHFDARPQTVNTGTAGTAYVRFKLASGASTGWYKCVGTANYSTRNRPFTCDLRSASLFPGTVATMTVTAIDFNK